MGCNTAILYHLLQKSTSTLNLKHMYIVQCTIYNTKCRNAHCKKNLLIILVHPTSLILFHESVFTLQISMSHIIKVTEFEKKSLNLAILHTSTWSLSFPDQTILISILIKSGIWRKCCIKLFLYLQYITLST